MNKQTPMTNWRWWICALLFVATTVNYLDRQVLSLTWKDFIAPEFHWTDAHYGNITAIFSLVYAVCMLFAGRFIDWMGTKKGFLWAIGVWSAGACLHAACGWATMQVEGLGSVAEMTALTGAAAAAVATVSVWFFIAARCILALGEAGNFPAAIKTTAEYFPKKDRAFATSIFNAGASVGALAAPATIPLLAQYFKDQGIGGGWEMAFIIIGGLGFIWMGFWVFMYAKPRESRFVNEAEIRMRSRLLRLPLRRLPRSANSPSWSASSSSRPGLLLWVSSLPTVYGGSTSSGLPPTSPTSMVTVPRRVWVLP